MDRQVALKRALKVALIAIPLAYLFNLVFAAANYESSGVFGDTFGAANALFSGTALLMLVYAVILQRDELDIIKEEREYTRRILRGQEQLSELQRSALTQQNFEQTFFSLVNLTQQEKSALKTSSLSKAAESAKFVIKSKVDENFPAENQNLIGKT